MDARLAELTGGDLVLRRGEWSGRFATLGATGDADSTAMHEYVTTVVSAVDAYVHALDADDFAEKLDESATRWDKLVALYNEALGHLGRAYLAREGVELTQHQAPDCVCALRQARAELP